MEVGQSLEAGSGIAPPFKTEAVARAEIRRYLERFDPRHDGIPKRIDPAVVERVLAEELAARDLPRWPAVRFADIADFYDATGVVPHLQKRLDRREETTDHIARSAAFVGAIAVLGDAAARSFARSYYHHLLSHPNADGAMTALVGCYANLTPDETSALTIGRIDALIAELEARAGADPGAHTAALELEDLRNGPLARADAAASLQQQIVATPEQGLRLDQLVDIYLDIDMRYYEHMRRWAIRMLLREARGGGAQAVAAAFRRSLPRIEAGPVDVRGPRASRALRAVEFVGGTITREERASLDPPTRVFDLLGND